MPTYTVISRIDHNPYDAPLVSPIAAIPGDVTVYGDGLDLVVVDMADPDSAMSAARDLSLPRRPDSAPQAADRWTVIGTADNGACPSWTVLAIVPGAHEVVGKFDSMLSHRWVVDIDDPAVWTAEDADRYAWRQVSDLYNEAWD